MRKRVLSLLLVMILVLSNISMVFADDTMLVSAQQETKKITIIHTNDTHARILDSDGGFGFAKIATIIKEAKEKNPNTLVLDAGDTLHGLPVVNISEGANAVKILNVAGYDFMTLGNHDFNYGQERLLELNDMAEFSMLSANILDSNGNYVFKPYEIKEMDGVKVGIFGLTTPETAYKTNPKNVEGLVFADAIETSKKMVEELKDKADVIIALAHIGLDESSVVTSKDIAESVEGIDVIIDGHSHNVLENGKLINNTLIAQTGDYDKNLGFVEIELVNNEVTKKEAKLISSTDNTVLPDEAVINLIKAIDEENLPLFSKVVAKTDIYLDGVRANVRTKETNLGNLSADAIRSISGAEIGFINGGGIRIDLQPGDITFGDVSKLFPFGNVVQVIELSGEEICSVLDNSVSGYPAAQGAFLHVSGLTFKFSQDREVGSRVYEVKIGGELIDTAEELAKKYTVAINDFLAAGGDGYDEFAGKKVIAEFGTLEEIFAMYLNANGTKGCEVSGRIVEAPAPTPIVPETEEVKEEVYIVVSGDVLWRIAQKYNITWEELAQYNKLANPHLIFPNQKIFIPVK